MEKLPNGVVPIVNLPGTGSLLSRSWQLYRDNFPTFIHLTLYFLLGLLVNISISAFLAFLTAESTSFIRVLVGLVIALINLASALFYSFIFAALMHAIQHASSGTPLSVAQALMKGRQSAVSLLWVSLLLSFVIYGSSIFIPLGAAAFLVPILFSVFFYFAVYLVVFEGARGFAALAKSRYLVEGLLMKVVWRYLVVVVLFLAFYAVAFFAKLIPSVGWLLFLLLTLAISFFLFPFLAVYEYYRYSDLAAVKRSVSFMLYKGEQTALAAWALLGGILLVISFVFGMLTPQDRAAFAQKTALTLLRAASPFMEQTSKNNTVLNDFFERLFPASQQEEEVLFNPDDDKAFEELLLEKTATSSKEK